MDLTNLLTVDLAKQVVIPFVVGFLSSAAVVALGVRSLKEYQRELERKRVVGELARFWTTRGASSVFHVVFGAERHQDKLEPRLGYAQAYGVAELVSILDEVFRGRVRVNPIPVQPGQSVPAGLFDDHVIMLGGELSLPQFGTLCRRLEVPYYQYDLSANDPNRRFVTKGDQLPLEDIRSRVVAGRLIADVGTVTRVVNPDNGNLVVLYNGNHGAGLLGAILSTTNAASFIPTGFAIDVEAQQLVVNVTKINDNIIDKNCRVGHVRGWVRFSLKLSNLQSALAPADETG